MRIFIWCWSSSRLRSWLQTFIYILIYFYINILYTFIYINNLSNDGICNIVVYADDTTLYSKCSQTSDLWQLLELVYELESDLWDSVNFGRKWFVNFNAAKTQLILFDRSNNTCVNEVKMGLFLKKNHILRCWGCWYLLNWIGILKLSLLLKLSSRKIGALTHSIKFLSPEGAMYLYKSTV